MADSAPIKRRGQVGERGVGSELEELEELEPGAQHFVEGMGLYFERLGIPRIGGRILGLLMMAERPLTLDEMARALKVSRASVSTNARTSVAVGMVEHVSLPGDRRDYYTFSPNAWTRRIEIAFPLFDLLERLAEQGLEALDPQNTIGRDRLQMAIEFCQFYRRESEAGLARWKEHIAARTDAPRRRAGGAV
jgi:hypothetical protein